MSPRLLFAAVLILNLHSEELRVDHVTVAGRDLRAMQSALSSAAGIKTEYGGPHSNHATEMALTSFPDGSYLELIAIQKEADPAAVAKHEWQKFLESNAGPCAWAVRPADLGAELGRLRAAGVSTSTARKNGRKRPDGVQLEWETAQVGTGNGTFHPFLIHDFTPRERRAYPSGNPTTIDFVGVVKVVLAVRDLEAAIGQFQKAYALGEPKRQNDPAFGAKLAWFSGTPVVLAAPIASGSWLAKRIDDFGEAPCAFVLGRTNGMTALSPSSWFGRRVVWVDDKALGWRLGMELPSK